MKRNCRGMTLLELLIAVAIFLVLAVLAYGGLDAVLNTSQAARDEMTELSALQRAMARLDADITQMAQRSVRDNYGDTLDTVLVEEEGANASRIEFTRLGHQNLTGEKRSNLQRIGYRLRGDTLVRESWSVLDRAQDSQPYQAELLSGVSRFTITLLRKPETTTPPVPGAPAEPALPQAVEINFEHKKWGTIRRLIKVAA